MATASLKQTEIRHDKAKANKYTRTQLTHAHVCIQVSASTTHKHMHIIVHNCLVPSPLCHLPTPYPLLLCKIGKTATITQKHHKTIAASCASHLSPLLPFSSPSDSPLFIQLTSAALLLCSVLPITSKMLFTVLTSCNVCKMHHIERRRLSTTVRYLVQSRDTFNYSQATHNYSVLQGMHSHHTHSDICVWVCVCACHICRHLKVCLWWIAFFV